MLNTDNGNEHLLECLVGASAGQTVGRPIKKRCNPWSAPASQLGDAQPVPPPPNAPPVTPREVIHAVDALVMTLQREVGGRLAQAPDLEGGAGRGGAETCMKSTS